MTNKTETADIAAIAAIDFAGLDLSTAAQKPFAVKLTHPVTKKLLGSVIYTAGNEHPEFKQHIRDEMDADQKAAAECMSRGEEYKLDANERERRALEKITLLIMLSGKSWEQINLDGKPVPFTANDVHAFLKRFRWVFRQVDDAASELKNFPTG